MVKSAELVAGVGSDDGRPLIDFDRPPLVPDFMPWTENIPLADLLFPTPGVHVMTTVAPPEAWGDTHEGPEPAPVLSTPPGGDNTLENGIVTGDQLRNEQSKDAVISRIMNLLTDGTPPLE